MAVPNRPGQQEPIPMPQPRRRLHLRHPLAVPHRMDGGRVILAHAPRRALVESGRPKVSTDILGFNADFGALWCGKGPAVRA